MERRNWLAGSAAILAAVLGSRSARGQDLQGAEKARRDQSVSDPGPENQPVREANSNTFLPPKTDHGEVPTFWSSFSTAHRRVQEGGWSRQITVDDFPISKEIAGVNMRLTAGGIRELHWHGAAEWALMLTGRARITAIDEEGRSFAKDVGPNDLWFFPAGIPHSIQGLAPDGCEFLLVFDDGKFSEGNTTLLSDWTRHTPPDVLAKNWGLAAGDVSPVYSVPPDGHYIFQQPVPPPLSEDQQRAQAGRDASRVAFDFALQTAEPSFKTRSGEVRIIDSRNFPVSKAIAAAHVVVKPGGLRELHWHPNSDEWQYYVQGRGRMTVFFNGGKARTADFNAGDVGYVPRTFGHYIENTGETDLIFLELFKADRFQDLSLSEWVTHTPPELVMQHLGLSKEALGRIPKTKQAIVPA